MNYSLITFTGFILCVLSGLVLSQRRCRNPNNKEGLCVQYRNCPFVQHVHKLYQDHIPKRIITQLTLMLMQCPASPNLFCCPIQAPFQRIEMRMEDSRLSHYDQAGLKLLQSVKNCGNKSNPKVSGGRKAKPGEFPWIALLKYDKDPKGEIICGGSLISEWHILTAAHCILNRPQVTAVRLGEHNLDTEKDCQELGGQSVCIPPYEEYGVQEAIVHPDYVHGNIHYDIAIIKLNRQVKPKWHIKPVCLPINEQSQSLSYDQSFFVAGWGKTDKTDAPTTLHRTLITRANLDECRMFYNNTDVNDKHICAKGKDIKHTCKGDSGGPVFFKHPFGNTYRTVQYGVVSLGGNQCGVTKRQPGIFASVIAMLPWITQQLL
ncbi:serine protease grass-like [Drosophila rhopaloa]|uniref:CLIP domain-containing serine protease n=2 Tax=Drosophila rhopaloa TaxID=1041015 RepID=A0ABM5HF13_DRORH|nr:serine protease grass-like [Drosophila rhopaloa]